MAVQGTGAWRLRAWAGAAVIGTAALVLAPRPLWAQTAAPSCDPAPAKAASVQGVVETQRVGSTEWRPVKLNDTFCPGDRIRVQANSRADVTMLNQSVLRLNANSAITVEAPKEGKTGVVELVRGAAHFFSRGPNSLEVKTPYTVAGVRGTEFLIDVDSQQTLVTVFEGTVVAENPQGSLTLRDGQSAAAQAGQAPALRVVVRPRDAVTWALYYPPIISPKPGEPASAAARAEQLLAVGSVDAARAEIDRALQANPKDPEALGLQAVILMVQGDRDRAYEIAQANVAQSPDSAVARIALSYVEQSRFNLGAARDNVRRAVELQPQNALAWARLAELDSAFGDYDGSARAAQRAAELQPDLSRTQTVLGFTQLIAINLAAAMESFDKAIALDQADPLPRLGLGLAKIRGGDLDGGARDIEIAASLDSNSSIIRSYLGKAYYEEKRTGLDEREFQMAKQLDPKDPTPWFYDAISKLMTNRPVEALQNMEKAQELNDNRAVYRSRLLLDSDAAARAAGQARIYTELGFQQRGLAEGWNAVNTDPSNFSAHRFLADTYANLPRHEIARVSELLQSQLLAPVTNTPLQPRLAVSNLFLLSALGPGLASFNEFGPLFNRDGLSLLVNGMVGTQGTAFGEAVVSGIAGRFGYSVGVSDFKTDGYRQNADQREGLVNAFAQYDFTPDFSAQFEYRYRKSEYGDLAQRFFPTAYFPGLRTEVDYDTYRAGLRYNFSPASVVLGSFMYQSRYTIESDSQPLAPAVSLDRRGPDDAKSAEVQNIYRGAKYTLTSGLGYFNVDGNIDSTQTLRVSVPLPPICLGPPAFRPPFCATLAQPRLVTSTSSIATDIRHYNGYVYANYTPVDPVMVTLGLSYDSIDASSLSVGTKDQWNPKFGLMWRPAAATAVRAAAFRTYKRTLITDQTLEPTQVAGFNQFFDDVNGTDGWRYGLGIDQKFKGEVYAGLEASKRTLDSPYTVGAINPQRAEEQIDERQARGYVYWIPHPWWALRADYLYDKWDRSNGPVGRPTELTTHRLPLGANFFHPSGWGGGVTVSYVNQDGQFAQGSGTDKFWVTDLALRYRLPKRYGFITAGVRNAFDQKFNYYDLDTKNPQLIPERMVFVQVTLALP